ncbi:sugar transferase [Gimesia fumaroli]|jgi:lipopolysaccharide/colanic/teichoic acid biosynthesis glycosyltransferase|uniref:UDP-N-acetylgalactosamine-undecaprenyl-phosphate N-acetylgalactosaminephosphotransferase n=1 Tax=Gimesia fumaroli TaxID=2527976 RepID=A0A518IAA6_9PLAN|nr:sugar transferase [Gimesia fumaroli]QDV49959.1 UDP-N-acetylgalactosamine-undecaprenyl-phosphate N-acetylgalactosaminephosphotransferase [Gimesia fumaroli]
MDDRQLSQKSGSAQDAKQGQPHFDPRLLAPVSGSADATENSEYFLKRPLDLLLSGFALIVLSPVFLMIAFLIKASSPGPVFFRQKRLGVNEAPFEILKFRSMRSDPEGAGPQFTSANDSRITGIGKLIRKTSLDELPQLINIFRGEMSLIGPRPYVGFELADTLQFKRELRASVRPGVSGLAQVSGRSQLTQDAVIEYDIDYVKKCSLKLDWQILLQTVRKVLSCEGTN